MTTALTLSLLANALLAFLSLDARRSASFWRRQWDHVFAMWSTEASATTSRVRAETAEALRRVWERDRWN